MKQLKLLILLPLLLLSSILSAQEIEVSVDRDEVARGETLTFTIRVYDQRQGMQLDLTPLTEDFDVLGTRTSSQIRSINGSVEAWTDYIVTLFPLDEGSVSIPSLSINEVETDPIAITVINQGPRSNQDSDELFLEIETNKESVYVQEQLLFTVRLYYTINGIRNPQFTELEMPETVIQLIGSPNQYEKLIDGQRYGVYEKRYVIFPQRSGPLEIPDILFRGEVTDGSSNFVFRNLNTRRVTAFIDGITIDIKERPATARNVDWLPVTDLSIEETWSGDITNLKVGDSVVRTLTMVAAGLDGAVLPPFGPEEIEGMNLYPDPADIQRTFVDGAIVGTRVETSTLVATASGELVIPEISVPWWNIDTDQQEASVIPATRLTIATVDGVLPSELAVESTADIQELLDATPVVDQAMIDAQARAEFIEVQVSYLNYFIALAFVIVAFSIYKLVLAPRRAEINSYVRSRRDSIAAHYHPENNEGVAFKQLAQACRSNNPLEIREALITWCDHYVQKRRVVSMEDIMQQQESSELGDMAISLQTLLFNSGNSTGDTGEFNSQQLLQIVSSLRKDRQKQQRQRQQQDKYALPPLYKT